MNGAQRRAERKSVYTVSGIESLIVFGVGRMQDIFVKADE
jgi:hypothetical protein